MIITMIIIMIITMIIDAVGDWVTWARHLAWDLSLEVDALAAEGLRRLRSF